MRANPGGRIGLSEIVGRDAFVGELWGVLRGQSLVLTSERRIGKTCVIRKMREECPDPGAVCVLSDLEALRSPSEFVEALYADVEDLLSRTDRARLKFGRLLSKLGGLEVHDIKIPALAPHWKNLLFALVEDIFNNAERTVAFLWDELPLFVYNVSKAEGQPVAMEVLDALRTLRQRHDRLRMVFTGSVGLHLVTRALRRGDYANDPTNDMRLMEVGPLDEADGTSLALQLIEGEAIQTPSRERLAHTVSEAVGRIPYYIHWLMSRIATSGGPVSEASVEQYLDSLIRDPNDPAHLRYYRERLDVYYDGGEKMIALAILDALAASEQPQGFDGLVNLVRHRIAGVGDEPVREALTLLGKDHYIARQEGSGAYQFRYPIVRRWWRFERC